MVQPWGSAQGLPHGVACVEKNIYVGTSRLSYAFWEHMAHEALLRESCWAGRSLHTWSRSEPDPQLCIMVFEEERGGIAARLPHHLHPWAALKKSGAVAHCDAAGLPSCVPQRSSPRAVKCVPQVLSFSPKLLTVLLKAASTAP